MAVTQNAFCIYWFLIKLQNVTMIKGIHFDNSLRMVFTRREGLIIGCIFFVVCLQVNGPTTGRAYYAPSPRRLLLDQTEARRAEKKISGHRPLPLFSNWSG